jgi:hypothetical protein
VYDIFVNRLLNKTPTLFGRISNAAMATRNDFFHGNPFLCFFFASLSLFILPSTLSLHHKRLTLYAMTLNAEHRVTVSFSPSCPSLPCHD